MLMKRKKMEIFKELKTTFWITNFLVIISQIGYAQTQDHQNYFFSQQNQGRFVPSTQFQNQRSNFFPTNNNFHQLGQRSGGSGGVIGSGSGSNAQNSQNGPPGSYQEQIIFLNNDGTTPQDATPSFQFQQFPSTRSPDYYELSPRPFGLGQESSPPVGPSSFARNPAVRPNSNNGFISQKLLNPAGRPNIPHQQSQFLAHFNEQQQQPHHGASVSSQEKQPSSTTQSNRLGRPFGSNSFSRNRPVTYTRQQQQQPPQQLQQSAEDTSPNQQQLPYRNSRNRFQPNSERTTSTTATSTTNAATEKSRYNRFGSSRIQKQQQQQQQSLPSRNSGSSFNPSRSRSTTTSASINKPSSKPKRPVFISREVNEPIHVKPRVPYNKIQINHNGSDRSKKLKTEFESIKTIPILTDHLEEEIREENHVNNEKAGIEDAKDAPEDNFEKLQLQEAITTPYFIETTVEPEVQSPEPPQTEQKQQQQQQQQETQSTSQEEVHQEISDIAELSENPDEKNQVILTSNFFLPGQSSESLEIENSAENVANSKEISKETSKEEKEPSAVEILSPPTTQRTGDYDYEYEDYEDKVSTDPSVEHDVKTNLPLTAVTTQKDFIQATTFRRNFDKVTESQISVSKISEAPDFNEVPEVSENYKPVHEIPNEDPIEVHEDQTEVQEIPIETSKKPEVFSVPDLKTTALNISEETVTVPIDDILEFTTVPTNSEISDILNNDHDNQHEHDNDSTEYDDDYDSSKESSGDYGDEEETAQPKPDDYLEHQVVSVVTTKSVINGSTSYPQEVTPSTSSTFSSDIVAINNESISAPEESPVNSLQENLVNVTDNKTEIEQSGQQQDEPVNNATEGYVVIASIQTSRSINGARFLPFLTIEQEETKQTFSELERKIHEQKNSRTTKKVPITDQSSDDSDKITTKDLTPIIAETTVEPNLTTPDLIEDDKLSIATDKPLPSQSTESIYDKLDRVQSDLSSGLLTGQFPILNEMPDLDTSTHSTSTTSGTKFSPRYNKFVPKTTGKPKYNFDEIPMDDLSGLVPTGFKVRTNSFRNRKITTTTAKTTTKTTTSKPSIESRANESQPPKPPRNFSIGRSFKSNPVSQDISLAGLLPKGFKFNDTTTEAPQKSLTDILSKIKFAESVDALVPKDYKEKILKSTTSKPFVTVMEDNSKFLPPGFNKFKISPTTSTSTTTTTTTTTKKPSVIPIVDNISNLLPPGFKLEKDDENIGGIDITKLLPKDKIIEIKNIPGLLPPGFDLNQSDNDKKSIHTSSSSSTSTSSSSSSSSSGGSKIDNFKVVFPKSLNKRPRITTPRPHQGPDGPPAPQITIKKGPPTRATTEFTGWPTQSTTPISIEKLLEQSRTANILADYFSTSTSTTSTTTTTTTTTPEPPKPTEPGHCRTECNLAGTIKIVDGVKWKPELLDHNTLEWKNLAKEVEAQLNDVYSTAPYLNNWYKKVRIDSFNKGSVLVDYFVELQNISRDVNTLEIKRLFHDALMQSPLTVIPLQSDDNDELFDDSNEYLEGKGEKLVRETYLLGKFVVDPVSTDFIVIPKSYSPTVEFADEDVIPQWAIVLIVIGVGSLCFIVIFGVTVLLSRHKNSKKSPTPLTADMLNELNKDHMGVDNYGADDFYNVDDAWNDTKQPIKPKRFTNSMHGSSASNIYDSWRSTRHAGDYYYDQHNYTPHHHHHHKIEHQQHPAQYQPDAFSDAHQMYTYNARARYLRDPYDPDY